LNLFDRFFGRFRDNYKNGFLPYRLWNTSPQFNDYSKDATKLAAIFSNPALLKVFTLQCDLFSLAKVYVYNKKDVQKDHPALDRLETPNPMQNGSQFLWDYMFWKMLGNSYLYMDSDNVDRENAPMYFLEPQKIEWPLSLERQKDKLIFSQSKLRDLMNTNIIYRYEDGTTFTFPLFKLCTVHDLTNGTGNFFKGYSRIDALYKVISNSETSLDSKNINVRYTGKFLVAGQADPNDVTKVPMSENEKKDIENKINGQTWQEKIEGEKQVHAVKSMVDIKRFVDDLRTLELDKSYLADYFLIGSMYNIPRDVLEAYQSSTFENQEKARAGHITYTLEPAGNAFADLLTKRWGLPKGWRIVISWDHLPFAQAMEKDRTAVKYQQAQTLTMLLRSGIPIEEINSFLDTNFTVTQSANQNQNTNN
jgi:hypothetical protein